eukprot:scaffold29_cov251-Pinguiococcus_pyrenoidosus.AAC.38
MGHGLSIFRARQGATSRRGLRDSSEFATAKRALRHGFVLSSPPSDLGETKLERRSTRKALGTRGSTIHLPLDHVAVSEGQREHIRGRWVP